MSAEVSLKPDPSNSPLLALAGANFSRKESTHADVVGFTSLLEPLITSAEFSRTDLHAFLRKAVELKITKATIHSGLEIVLRAQVRRDPARALEVFDTLPLHLLTVNLLDRGVRASLLLHDVKGAKNMIAAFDSKGTDFDRRNLYQLRGVAKILGDERDEGIADLRSAIDHKGDLSTVGIVIADLVVRGDLERAQKLLNVAEEIEISLHTLNVAWDHIKREGADPSGTDLMRLIEAASAKVSIIETFFLEEEVAFLRGDLATSARALRKAFDHGAILPVSKRVTERCKSYMAAGMCSEAEAILLPFLQRDSSLLAPWQVKELLIAAVTHGDERLALPLFVIYLNVDFDRGLHIIPTLSRNNKEILESLLMRQRSHCNPHLWCEMWISHASYQLLCGNHGAAQAALALVYSSGDSVDLSKVTKATLKMKGLPSELRAEWYEMITAFFYTSRHGPFFYTTRALLRPGSDFLQKHLLAETVEKLSVRFEDTSLRWLATQYWIESGDIERAGKCWGDINLAAYKTKWRFYILIQHAWPEQAPTVQSRFNIDTSKFTPRRDEFFWDIKPGSRDLRWERIHDQLDRGHFVTAAEMTLNDIYRLEDEVKNPKDSHRFGPVEAMRLYARFIGLKSAPDRRAHYDRVMDSLINLKWLQPHHRAGFENLMETASQISTARLRVRNSAST